MTIWNQGEYYKDLGEAVVGFDHQINNGPSDELIKIHGFNVSPDNNGDFVQSNDKRRYNEDEMDAIRTFSIARKLVSIVQEINGKPIVWQWIAEGNTEPLQIFIRNNGINSRYSRENKCVQLDYYGPYQNWSYYCRSVDIVAHEIGHAILDGLKPGWYNADIETRGLAEAFCDFCAMLMITANINLCREVIQETKGNFTKTNILSVFGAGYGFEENQSSCIRDANNNFQYHNNISTAYEYCELITGILYEVLTQSALESGNRLKPPETILFESASIWAKAVINSVIKCSEEKTTLSEFFFHLENAFPPKEIVLNSCKKRNLI